MCAWCALTILWSAAPREMQQRQAPLQHWSGACQFHGSSLRDRLPTLCFSSLCFGLRPGSVYQRCRDLFGSCAPDRRGEASPPPAIVRKPGCRASRAWARLRRGIGRARSTKWPLCSRSCALPSDDSNARKVARRCFGLIGRRIDRDAVESRVLWESIAQDTKVRGSLSQGASRVRACVVSRTGPSGIG